MRAPVVLISVRLKPSSIADVTLAKFLPLPEGFDFVIRGERPAASRIDGSPLALAQTINAGAPRFDFAGKLGGVLPGPRPARTPLVPKWFSPQGSWRQDSPKCPQVPRD